MLSYILFFYAWYPYNFVAGLYNRTLIKVISYVQGWRLVASGYLSYLAYVWYISRQGPIVDSVYIV